MSGEEQTRTMSDALDDGTYWVTRDGRKLLIADMSASHRENTVAMLLRGAQKAMVRYHSLWNMRGLGMASEMTMDHLENEFYRAMTATPQQAREWLLTTKTVKALMDGLGMVVIVSDYRIVDTKGRSVCIWDLSSKKAAAIIGVIDASPQSHRMQETHAYENLCAQAADDIARDLRVLAGIDGRDYFGHDAMGAVVHGGKKVRLISYDPNNRQGYDKIEADVAREAAKAKRHERKVQEAAAEGIKRVHMDALADLFRGPQNDNLEGPML